MRNWAALKQKKVDRWDHTSHRNGLLENTTLANPLVTDQAASASRHCSVCSAASQIDGWVVDLEPDRAANYQPPRGLEECTLAEDGIHSTRTRRSTDPTGPLPSA